MEILVTLKNIKNLIKFKEFGVKGVIVGTRAFSTRYTFDLNELKTINEKCKQLNLDLYIIIDTFIEEKDRPVLYEYLEIIKELNPKGIYFNDLSVLYIAKELGLESKLSYDPSTLMTNSLDANFYLNQGIDSVVLAREITLEEIKRIAHYTNNRVDMQIFGYLKTASSKRHFLKNYFEFLNEKYNLKDKETIRIVEETRDYNMPILENRYGTHIYTDYIINTYEEYELLNSIIKRGIIDDSFIKEDELFTVLSDYQIINKDNAKKLKEDLINKYPKLSFDTGYLYQKTNLTK